MGVSNGPMVDTFKAPFRTESCTDLAAMSGRMGANMKATISSTKSMEREPTLTPMVASTAVSGLMACSTASAALLMLNNSMKRKEPGNLVNSKNGLTLQNSD